MESLKDHEHLIVNRKIASIGAALVVLTGMLTFIAGYFWGYRKAMDGIQLNITQQAFADQVSYAVNNVVDDAVKAEVSIDQSNLPLTDIEPITLAAAPILEMKPDLPETAALNADSAVYYAELIGFGHLKKAQAFMEQAKQKGYPVLMRKRTGRSGNGKKITWYQIITENMTDRDRLVKLVDSIQQTEKLQNVKIKKA